MKKLLVLMPLLASSLLYSQGLSLVNQSKGVVLLTGKHESCRIKMTPAGEIIHTKCKYFTNSKNVNVVCTKKKTMCKTVEEVDNFLNDRSLSTKQFDSIGDIKDMPYYQARKRILKAGYTIKKSASLSEYGQEAFLYKKGYTEVEACSGHSFMPCRFEFNAKNGKVLIVTTYTNEPKLDNIFITSWYEE